MTGRKVTRRASMRRKSMRSPSVSRSSGSKTPRSFVSEPHASGKNSFNSSVEKLDVNQSDSPANNNSERLSNKPEEVMTSSELLADELAAVKINDSKEKLIEEVEKKEEKREEESESVDAPIAAVAALNGSKASLNSKGSIADLAKNRSKSSINEFSDAKSQAGSTQDLSAAKSAEELVAVPLDNAEKSEEEPAAKEDEVEVREFESAPAVAAASTEAVAGTTTENPAEIQTETTEETKKSCLSQKAAKCRCVIS